MICRQCYYGRKTGLFYLSLSKRTGYDLGLINLEFWPNELQWVIKSWKMLNPIRSSFPITLKHWGKQRKINGLYGENLTHNLFFSLLFFPTGIEPFQRKSKWIIVLENISSPLCHITIAFSLCILCNMNNSILLARWYTCHLIGEL